MKRGVIFILILLIVLIGGIAFFKISLDKKRLTGEVTSQVVSMNVSVIQPPPILTILNPHNETYLNNNLLLNFSAVYANNLWYNIDSESNTTISSATYFNVNGSSSHTLFLYANNSNSTISKNVTFTINSSLLTILYSEYNGSNKGNSISFNNYSYEDLQNLSGIILENPNYGKIQFNEAINVTNDSNLGDNILDLDTNINISFNRIELNTTALPNFNKQAILSLYNLTFTNPRILKDGSVCPATICTINNYSNEILIFNVTGFSVYSAEETPEGEINQQLPNVEGGGRVAKNTTETNQTSKKEKIKCESPYIEYEKGCCLDKDNNDVCDSDENKEIKKEKNTLQMVLYYFWVVFSLFLISFSVYSMMKRGNSKKINKVYFYLLVLIFVISVVYIFLLMGGLENYLIHGQIISTPEEKTVKILQTPVMIIIAILTLLILILFYLKIKKKNIEKD